MSKDTITTAAKEFVKFLNKSPSPFHAVDEIRKLLLENGFKELKETDHWTINQLDKFFVTKNQSTLLAFAVGGKYEPGNGFTIIGTHTDSPCLKLKPGTKLVKHGYIQLGVELYGGGIWHTWFDRDLKLAGRALVKTPNKEIKHVLVHIDRPILRIPTIAIHLQRDQNEKFEFNKENHLSPILATVFQEQLEYPSEKLINEKNQEDKHAPALMRLLSQELKTDWENILDFELCLADHMPSNIGGLYEEFIFSGRLDNLHSTYCALKGFIEANSNEISLKNDNNIRLLCQFDNEEVGSESAQGAGSAFVEHVIRRLSSSKNNLNAYEEAIAKSILISADMAHAIHPGYPDKHDEINRPTLNKGIVLKYNANQRYATTAVTSAIVKDIAKNAGVKTQQFSNRNDLACGSTIGPILSTKLGIATIDLGSPQLSMHSIREMCSVNTVKNAITLFKAIYEKYPETFSSISGI